MIKDILEFIRKEKFYFILFLAVTMLYSTLLFVSNRSAETEKPSEAILAFQEAEQKVIEKLSKPDTIEDYLKEKPKLPFWFNLFTMIMIAAFGVGLMIDFRIFFHPTWRRSFSVDQEESRVEWKVSMLFKVLVLWMTFAIATSLLFGLLQHWFFKNLSTNFYVLFQTTLLDICIVILVFYMVRKQAGGWSDLGVRKPVSGFIKEIGVGFGGYLAIVPAFFMVLVGLILIASLMKYEPPPHPLVGVFLEEEKKAPFLVVYSILLASFLGPFFEELFFRGFCYPIFKKRWGMGWGMVLSAFFFALIHHSGFAFWPIFVLGIGLAYLYEKRKSLVAPIALHIIHNSFFIAYFFIAKQFVLSQGAG